MWSIIRIGTKKFGDQIIGLHKISKTANILCQQVAFISHKEKRIDLPPRPAPFPYKEKNFRYWTGMFDSTLKRFDENSKVIIVEGPIAAGKDEFCRDLADQFDMQYFPPLDFDDWYKSYPYFIDFRDYDHELPVNLQSHDLKKYLKQPIHINTTSMQLHFLRFKYDRYCDALIHVMSTGQGAVVQRSPWSDFVFVEAMYKAGYISRNARSMYYDITLRSLHYLVKPHVVIYLDVTPENTLENIKKKQGDPDEVNSKVFTLDYLRNIESAYKNQFFQKLDPYCHILKYNWNTDRDIDFVIEDIEALNFNFKEKDDKMEEWNTEDGDIWTYRRELYSPFGRHEFLDLRINTMRTDVEEMAITGEEEEIWSNFRMTVPGCRYEPGFDPDLDGSTLFKTKELCPAYLLRSAKTLADDGKPLRKKLQ